MRTRALSALQLDDQAYPLLFANETYRSCPRARRRPGAVPGSEQHATLRAMAAFETLWLE
jgi:hypothetical protein